MTYLDEDRQEDARQEAAELRLDAECVERGYCIPCRGEGEVYDPVRRRHVGCLRCRGTGEA